MSWKTALRRIQVWVCYEHKIGYEFLYSCGSLLWSLEDVSPQHKSCDCPADQFNAKTSTVYGCSFVAKLSWKKIFFFEKIFVFFTKYTLFAEKNVFIWKKSFIMKMFLLKKTSFTERNINENVKRYISFQKYIFTQKMFVLQIKYKSFWSVYSFCKKKIILIIKNIFVKNSLWTQ